MGLIPYIILVLYSCKVQSIESFSGKSNDSFDGRDHSDVSFPQVIEQERRSDDSKCRAVKLRINNGRVADDYEFPFVGALIYREPEPQVNDQFCIGTLITTSHVLTACHCLVEGEIKYPHKITTPSKIDILVGTIDLYSYVDNRENVLGCGQVRSGRGIRVHQDCTLENNELKKDFGVIVVEVPFEFPRRPCVNVVFFPEETLGHRERTDLMAENHELCVTVGWGLASEGIASSLLKVLSVTLRPGKWCKEKIMNLTKDQDGGPDIFGPSDSLCAVGCEEGETVCISDSGAPLLCGPNRILVGVVSYGPGNASCGNDKIPFVYARVDGWEFWIWEVVFNLTSSSDLYDSASIMDLQPCIIAALSMVIILKETYLETQIPI